MKPQELNIPNILFLGVGLGLLRALLKPDAIKCFGAQVITSPGMGLILMKPTGDNPAETFQDLWDGMG